MQKKPIIAIPLGDPAGIGPEIVVKSFVDPRLRESRLLVIGERKTVENAIRICGLDLNVRCVEEAGDACFEAGTLNLIDLRNIDTDSFHFGKVSAMCGKAAFEYIEKSIQLALARHVDAVATPPINKEAFASAGIPYIGHTEVFESLTGSKDPLTMFEVGGLRVFFLTRHVSLRKACDLVTKDRIVDYVPRCLEALKKLGVAQGQLAVAGLNPHCGEHGLFGDEEVTEIEPAVTRLKELGYDVVGPVPADSVFHQAKQGRYAAVLSLYHDQGHIACKTLDFERTISVTNGMPILRTSVDHGTAFDIAGRGIASEASMVEAIVVAEKYAPYFACQSR